MKSCKISDKELMTQEQALRESLCIWSSVRWGHSALRRLLEREDLSSTDLRVQLTAILDQQDLLAPVMEDRLTTELTNSVLRRRDIVLSNTQAKAFQEDSIVEFISSPLVGSDLFDFDKEVIKEELEVQTSKAVMASTRRNIQVVEAKPKAQTTPAVAAPVAVASTSQTYQSSARPSVSQPFPSVHTDYKSGKSRRGGNQSSSSKRGSSSSNRGSRGSYSSRRGGSSYSKNRYSRK